MKHGTILRVKLMVPLVVLLLACAALAVSHRNNALAIHAVFTADDARAASVTSFDIQVVSRDGVASSPYKKIIDESIQRILAHQEKQIAARHEQEVACIYMLIGAAGLFYLIYLFLALPGYSKENEVHLDERE